MSRRVSRATTHLPPDELKRRTRREPRWRLRSHWEILHTVTIAPRAAHLVAQQMGISVPTVRRVLSAYNRGGPAAVERRGRGGRQRAYLAHFQRP